MAITINPIHEGPGLLYAAHGALTDTDFIEANTRLLAFGDHIKQFVYCLVDLTAVDSLEISPTGLATMAQHGNRIAAHFHPRIVVAVTAPDDRSMQLAALWTSLIRERGWDSMIFRTRDEALSWVRQKVRENVGIDLTGP